MKKLKLFACLVLLLRISNAYSQKTNFEFASPNGELKVAITLGDKIYYSILAKNEELTSQNHLGLVLKNESLGLNPKLAGSKIGKVNEVIKPAIPLKFSTVANVYNYLLLNFKGGVFS